MPSRVVASVVAAAGMAAGVFFVHPSVAGASDGSGGYASTTDSSAAGGQITVEAGTVQSSPGGASEGDSSSGTAASTVYECTYAVASAQIQQFLGPGGATPGEWVIYTCPNTAIDGALPLEWLPTAQAPMPVNAAALAEEAVSKLGLAAPSIEMAPPSGAAQLVGVATWLWLDSGAWQTRSASATAGTVTATATAAPSKVVWNMGDGNELTCVGPGTPYNSSDPSATTDCSYTWTQPGSYQVTATVYWAVVWTAVGAPGGGNLGLQAGPPAEAQVQVTESQAINTPSGGSN